MVIEYARNVLGMKDANTSEIEPNAKNLVIDIMPEQKKLIAEGKYGATMRLGSYPAHLRSGSLALEAYISAGVLPKTGGKQEISEWHRHCYEVNPKYHIKFTEGGLVFSGVSPNGG